MGLPRVIKKGVGIVRRVGVLLVVLSLILVLAGCGQGKNVPISGIMAKVKEAIKADLIGNGFSEDDFTEGLPGFMEADILEEDFSMLLSDPELLDRDLIGEGIVLGSMFNINSSEIIVLKAKEESDVQTLKEALEKEKENRLKQWESYLPDQYEKVQNTLIKVEGKYLLYATYDDTTIIEESFDAALGGK
jgi:hypothetical protein